MSNNSEDEISAIVRTVHHQDDFFNNEPTDGIIAIFDFDYERIIEFRKSVAIASMLFPPVLIFGTLFACYPCFYEQQIEWDVYSQHVAITRDGIKFVKDKRKTGCGLNCTDSGKISKTVPFDKITDCDVTEPAGATCCCIDNVLSVVNVDTASSGGGEGGPSHELSLAGLKEPLKFKQLVWAMKRENAKGGSIPTISKQQSTFATSSPVALSSEVMDRGMSNEETNAILREIRSELKELNVNIKNMNS